MLLAVLFLVVRDGGGSLLSAMLSTPAWRHSLEATQTSSLIAPLQRTEAIFIRLAVLALTVVLCAPDAEYLLVSQPSYILFHSLF